LKFVGTHASNYLPITGTLQKDKQKMIALVDQVLAGRDARLLRPDSMRGL
ncbi:MAG TPA: radical SAM protein, partial [Syntrophaceae bacterium]|nr:radical SAM protein [Syntrophaceae bacterium]